jgi:pimeloyl-ACP methyl ester carboxylesterase
MWFSISSRAAVTAEHLPVVSRVVRITTGDGATLEAEEWLPSKDARPAASILLIHSFGNSRKAWGAFPETLAGAGYRVLAIDLRGHGGSSPVSGDPERLLTDPTLSPQDLSAGLGWLRGAPGADRSRLAVIGASVGANLACVASGWGLVRTAVALSPHRDRVHLLAGARPLHLQSILFLATSGDPGRESFARRLSIETGPPREVHIYAGTEHGEAILAAHPESVEHIRDWLRRTL